ncbi:MAG: hypothetical protein VKK42_02395 [Lyngbya sp.]|nr:hypothetical protein [Lyngbya sp.]
MKKRQELPRAGSKPDHKLTGGVNPLYLTTMNHEEALRRIAELEAENERLKVELSKAKNSLARAKDSDPVERCSETRVRKLANEAALNLTRHLNGWIISLGDRRQWYKRLRDIWEILITGDWKLSELIPPKHSPQYREPDKEATPKLRLKNPSLAPNPNLPTPDSLAAENYTKVNEKKPTYVTAKDRFWEPPGWRRWWFINHEKPTEQPKDFWHEGSDSINNSTPPVVENNSPQWELDESVIPF